jgi:dTDP-4-amino-4,6-dideoxygalactose transaminase
MTPIPFNRARLMGNEIEYMLQAVANMQISGDGPFTQRCQAFLEDLLNVRRVLLTTSCTDALEMAALLLDLSPGDEVIVPSFTFVSTANAFVLRGARPVFIDVRPDTLNMDESQLERLITDRTKAVIPVHYAGVGCEMDAITDIATKRDIRIVEDNAHGLFAKYKQRYLGTFGCLATQSFHETKNVTCGEGGALVVNDPFYLERAEVLREKGTDRSRFFRGLVDKYTWVDVGSSYLPSDLLAAFLFAQLEVVDQIQIDRKRAWNFYFDNLAQWAEEHSVRLPVIPAHCQQSFHMFYLLLPSGDDRQELMDYLKKRQIQSVFHYVPLHLSRMGKQFGGREGDCPVTEDVTDRLLRLPFYNGFAEEQQMRVISALKDFREWDPRMGRIRAAAR